MYYFSHSCTQFVNIYLSIQSQYILYLLNYFYTYFIIFLFIFWLSVDSTVSLLLSTLFRSVLVKIPFYLSSKENVQKLNLTETIDQVMMPEWGESQNQTNVGEFIRSWRHVILMGRKWKWDTETHDWLLVCLFLLWKCFGQLTACNWLKVSYCNCLGLS